ncbi:MAG TPA: acyltransferase family protein [Cyclobacteriaceae bacterium]
MLTTSRRYDIDWIRVIAIGLLLIYHIAIGFQPWGIMIGFIATEKTWGSLWIPMSMLNVWRIPLLFFVSGMGVYFALQNRNWKQLLIERASRILVPFVFGIFVIVPIHLYLWRYYYKMDLIYQPDPGHLWFLGNIFAYVVLLLPLLFYLKRNENGTLASFIRKVLSHPIGLLPVIGAFILEALILKPYPYEMYARTWHGFFLGILAFFFGFCFVLSGDSFWKMILKWRWLFIALAIVLFTIRITVFQMNVPISLLVTESDCWIISVLAFGYRYLNHPGKALNYLSQAAYPVYILHMIFLYLGAVLIFSLDIAAPVQFILLLLFTVAGCFGFYELSRRVNIIRPLFGLKLK